MRDAISLPGLYASAAAGPLLPVRERSGDPILKLALDGVVYIPTSPEIRLACRYCDMLSPHETAMR